MKIAIFGILPFSGLIKEGFQILGHTISSENPVVVNSGRTTKSPSLMEARCIIISICASVHAVSFGTTSCWIA